MRNPQSEERRENTIKDRPLEMKVSKESSKFKKSSLTSQQLTKPTLQKNENNP